MTDGAESSLQGPAEAVTMQNLSSDLGTSKRPRDSRLVHMVLANMAVNAYQERVPVQLLDFCYRYTSSTLQDALHLTSESVQNATGSGRIVNANNDLSNVTLQALRLSIAARTQYQFSPSLPKETLIELAAEKNRVALPMLTKECGLRLPPEKYCLTGIGLDLRDEWDSDTREEANKREEAIDISMNEAIVEQDSDNDERMEDVFNET